MWAKPVSEVASTIWVLCELRTTGMRREVARRGEVETNLPFQLTCHIDFSFPASPQMPSPVFFYLRASVVVISW